MLAMGLDACKIVVMTDQFSEFKQPQDDMDKTEGHVDMLRGVVEALRKDFNRKVAAGLVRDPQKLKGLAAKIFEIADETIYLAEEVQRVAGVYDDSEQPVAPQPDMLTESGEPIVLSKDARELLHILSAHDGKPMSPRELLECWV